MVEILEYSPEPTRLRRRRRIIRAGILFSLALVATVGLRYRKPVTNHIAAMYWARQCAGFTAPAETPIHVTDAAKNFAELKRDRNYVALPMSQPPAILAFDPYAWRAWRRFAVIPGSRFVPYSVGTLFLHELRTPAGIRRIVHVETWQGNAYAPMRSLATTVVEPPTLMSGSRILSSPGGVTWSGPFAPVTYRFGQPDPNDPTHFTIEWLAADESDLGDQPRSGVIDGRLGDDDRVDFTLRPTPTTLDTVAPSP